MRLKSVFYQERGPLSIKVIFVENIRFNQGIDEENLKF
jgi:hypothetical protein